MWFCCDYRTVYDSPLLELYKVSYAWYGLIGLSSCIIIGVMVSALTGGCRRCRYRHCRLANKLGVRTTINGCCSVHASAERQNVEWTNWMPGNFWKTFNTRKRAVAKALHLKGRTTSCQSFWRIMRIFGVFRVFWFENIMFSDVLCTPAWQPLDTTWLWPRPFVHRSS